jgi:hypothetical protein
MGKITDTKRANLEQRQADERDKLAVECAILEQIPDSLSHVEWSAHPYKLHGRTGSLHARVPFSRYTSDGKPDPTLDDALTLARTFPDHAPMAFMRDGSAGLYTREYLETLSDEKQDRAEIHRIAPFWARFDSISDVFEIGWIARIADRWIECEIHFHTYSNVARTIGRRIVEYERAGRGDNSRIISVRTNTVQMNPAFTVFGNCSAQVVRYSSGSNDRPGDVLIYWEIGNMDDAEISDDDGRTYRPLIVVDLLERMRAALNGGK